MSQQIVAAEPKSCANAKFYWMLATAINPIPIVFFVGRKKRNEFVVLQIVFAIFFLFCILLAATKCEVHWCTYAANIAGHTIRNYEIMCMKHTHLPLVAVLHLLVVAAIVVVDDVDIIGSDNIILRPSAFYWNRNCVLTDVDGDAKHLIVLILNIEWWPWSHVRKSEDCVAHRWLCRRCTFYMVRKLLKFFHEIVIMRKAPLLISTHSILVHIMRLRAKCKTLFRPADRKRAREMPVTNNNK